MKVFTEINSGADLLNFEAWSGGAEVLKEIEDLGIEDDVFGYLDDLGEAFSETELNDILWFDEGIEDLIMNAQEDYEREHH